MFPDGVNAGQSAPHLNGRRNTAELAGPAPLRAGAASGSYLIRAKHKPGAFRKAISQGRLIQKHFELGEFFQVSVESLRCTRRMFFLSRDSSHMFSECLKCCS